VLHDAPHVTLVVMQVLLMLAHVRSVDLEDTVLLSILLWDLTTALTAEPDILRFQVHLPALYVNLENLLELSLVHVLHVTLDTLASSMSRLVTVQSVRLVLLQLSVDLFVTAVKLVDMPIPQGRVFVLCVFKDIPVL